MEAIILLRFGKLEHIQVPLRKDLVNWRKRQRNKRDDRYYIVPESAVGTGVGLRSH